MSVYSFNGFTPVVKKSILARETRARGEIDRQNLLYIV